MANKSVNFEDIWEKFPEHLKNCIDEEFFKNPNTQLRSIINYHAVKESFTELGDLAKQTVKDIISDPHREEEIKNIFKNYVMNTSL